MKGDRDLCPEWVNSTFITLGADRNGVLIEMKHCDPADEEWFCLMMCQNGTDDVHWKAYRNGDNSVPPPLSPIPYDSFFVRQWSEEPRPPKSCDLYTEAEIEQLKRRLPPISIGILTRGSEFASLRYSLATWLDSGLLGAVNEVMIMINGVTEYNLAELEELTKPPLNLTILSSLDNEGISRGIHWLMGNASNDNFLFLEKDFRLVESIGCALEQLTAGVALVSSGRADIIRYRSRYNAGVPDYIGRAFIGKENLTFTIQSDVHCNFYHWVERPAVKWPNIFQVCMEEPLFYCVLSERCAWTNNPFLLSVKWYKDNFLDKHPEIALADPAFNVENYLRGDIWYRPQWVIALGDGLFRHCDVGKFGFI